MTLNTAPLTFHLTFNRGEGNPRLKTKETHTHIIFPLFAHPPYACTWSCIKTCTIVYGVMLCDSTSTKSDSRSSYGRICLVKSSISSRVTDFSYIPSCPEERRYFPDVIIAVSHSLQWGEQEKKVLFVYNSLI